MQKNYSSINLLASAKVSHNPLPHVFW